MINDSGVSDSQGDTEAQTAAVADEKAVRSHAIFLNMLGKPAFVHAS